MEEDPKILKIDFPQIWDLSLGDQTKIKNAWNEDDLQKKTTSKY